MICPKDNSNDFDDIDCRDCEWYYQCFSMWQDGNIWGKEQERLDNDHNAYDEPMGDNFPKFSVEHLNAQEQEIKNSINIIGDYSTWETIETISDAKLRVRYRMIYLKLGGRIPEKGIENVM